MLTMIRDFARCIHKDETGATAIEYGMMAALIAVLIITAVSTIGTKLQSAFETVAGKL